MKFITAVAFLAAAVYGASIDDLPQCAQACVRDGAKKAGCGEDDVPCLCSNINKIQGDEAQCIIDACGVDVAVSKLTLLTTCTGRADNANKRQTRSSLPPRSFAASKLAILNERSSKQ